jgi:hypothetical protein
MKVNIFKNPFLFWLLAGTSCRDLGFFFLNKNFEIWRSRSNVFLHKIPFKCVEIIFSGLKKREIRGKQNTAPSEKNQNKTKLLPLKALASGDARPEGRRHRRRRREHGVGRKHLPAMSRTTLLADDGRRVVVVGGESTTIELTVSNAI